MGIKVRFLQSEESNLLLLPNEDFLCSLEIINTQGDQVYLGNLKQGKNQIAIPKLTKGLYMLIAWGANQVKTEQLIIS